MIIHGRNEEKLETVKEKLGTIEGHIADFSNMKEVEAFASVLKEKHSHLDVLINNAGVFNSSTERTEEGLDIRFAVNTVAPYLLTKSLLPLMDETSRVINLSSAAQEPVNLDQMMTEKRVEEGEAYAQSKLALTMWTFEMAKKVRPLLVAVNPKSLLGSKMVKAAFGVDGHDIGIGADILCRAALSEEFKDASGKYYDNDKEAFGEPHPDAYDEKKCRTLMQTLDELISR